MAKKNQTDDFLGSRGFRGGNGKFPFFIDKSNLYNKAGLGNFTGTSDQDVALNNFLTNAENKVGLQINPDNVNRVVDLSKNITTPSNMVITPTGEVVKGGPQPQLSSRNISPSGAVKEEFVTPGVPAGPEYTKPGVPVGPEYTKPGVPVGPEYTKPGVPVGQGETIGGTDKGVSAPPPAPSTTPPTPEGFAPDLTKAEPGETIDLGPDGKYKKNEDGTFTPIPPEGEPEGEPEAPPEAPPEGDPEKAGTDIQGGATPDAGDLGADTGTETDVVNDVLNDPKFQLYLESIRLKVDSALATAESAKQALERKFQQDKSELEQSLANRGMFFSGVRATKVRALAVELAASELEIDRKMANQLLDANIDLRKEIYTRVSQVAKDAQQDKKDAVAQLNKAGFAVVGDQLVPTVSAQRLALSQQKKQQEQVEKAQKRLRGQSLLEIISAGITNPAKIAEKIPGATISEINSAISVFQKAQEKPNEWEIREFNNNLIAIEKDPKTGVPISQQVILKGDKDVFSTFTDANGVQQLSNMGFSRADTRATLDLKTELTGKSIDMLLDQVYGKEPDLPTGVSGFALQLKQQIVANKGALDQRGGRDVAERIVLNAGFNPDSDEWDEFLDEVF